MRLYPLALVPLVLALVAIIFAVGTTGPQMYLTVGVATATFLVSASILFTYGRRSAEAKQVPLENFSLWTDVGEPAAELRRLSLGDNVAAAHIASTDLASLAANAELLQSRAYMLVGRVGFEGLREEKIHRRAENLANDINAITKKISSMRSLSVEVIAPIELCAAQADRIANKFFEIEGGKSDIVYLYIDPLRRAAEKLSRDLRLASANISKFLLWTPKVEVPSVPKVGEQPPPKTELPSPPTVEAPSEPKAELSSESIADKTSEPITDNKV